MLLCVCVLCVCVCVSVCVCVFVCMCVCSGHSHVHALVKGNTSLAIGHSIHGVHLKVAQTKEHIQKGLKTNARIE